MQTADVLLEFLKDVPQLSMLLLIGGTDVEEFYEKGGNILVGTPGRIEDFLKQAKGMFRLKFEVLVLDEADRLLEMGFTTAVTSILEKLPRQRRTGLFSATQTSEVAELMRAGMRNPVKVQVKVEVPKAKLEQVTPASLVNSYMVCGMDEKFAQLMHFLKTHEDSKIIVYFLTCACVDYFHKEKNKNVGPNLFVAFTLCIHFKQLVESLKSVVKVPLFSLHGKIPQSKRSAIYSKFLALDIGVVFTTDLAARGLDFPDVDWVLQYDPPQNPKSFVHRIGRTARMGKFGEAVIFLAPSEIDYVDFLRLKKVPIKEVPKAECPPDFSDCLKKLCLNDREYFEKSQIAYVSYIRGYKEHHCSYIFKFSRLDFIALAKGFLLVKIPKMPEIKDKDMSVFEGIRDAEALKIPFLNKKKEEQRQGKLGRYEEERAQRSKQKREREKNAPWSKQKKKKEKKRQREAGRLGMTAEDIEDINREAKLMTKLKRRKISEKEFEDAVGNESEVEDANSDPEKTKANVADRKKENSRTQNNKKRAAYTKKNEAKFDKLEEHREDNINGNDHVVRNGPKTKKKEKDASKLPVQKLRSFPKKNKHKKPRSIV